MKNRSSRATDPDGAQSGQSTFRIFTYLRLVWLTTAIAATIVLARAAMEVTAVYFISPTVSTVVQGITESGGKHPDFLGWIMNTNAGRQFRMTLLWMGLSQLGLGALIFLKSIWDTKFSMRAVYHLRGEVYDKLQRLSLSVYDRITSGQLMNRALSDLQNVRMFLNLGFLGALDVVASLTAYLTLLGLRSPWLLLGALIPIPLWTLVIVYFGKKLQPAYRSQQENLDRLMVSMTENYAGIQVVRGLGAEAREIARYRGLNAGLLREQEKGIRIESRLMPLLRVVTVSAHIILFTICVFLIRHGQAGIGDLMILGVAMGAMLAKLQQVNSIVIAYRKASVSARRLFEIIDLESPSPSKRKPQQQKLIVTQGEIQIERLSFGYEPQRPILKGINTVLEGGRTTLLLGPTGSGKSTLASLIGRFYSPQEGRILIDGQDISAVDTIALRRAVGFVFQDTFLSSDTIRNNIGYGRDDVSEDMMIKAARMAHADEFIRTLPKGYDTLLGEGGVALSGGQRQRLAIARALAYDPPILIFDDPASALDTGTEAAVYRNLVDGLGGRTVLIIAHRLSQGGRTDRVLIMENGQVVEQGSSCELEQSHPFLRSLLAQNV